MWVQLHSLAQRLLASVGVIFVEDLAKCRASINALDERCDDLDARIAEFVEVPKV